MRKENKEYIFVIIGLLYVDNLYMCVMFWLHCLKSFAFVLGKC